MRELDNSEAATRDFLLKKVFLEITLNSQENTCTRDSFLINFIKKEALAQVFSCRFCEISKNTVFTEHLWAIASVLENCKMRAKVDESYSCWEGILFRAPKCQLKDYFYSKFCCAFYLLALKVSGFKKKFYLDSKIN